VDGCLDAVDELLHLFDIGLFGDGIVANQQQILFSAAFLHTVADLINAVWREYGHHVAQPRHIPFEFLIALGNCNSLSLTRPNDLNLWFVGVIGFEGDHADLLWVLRPEFSDHAARHNILQTGWADCSKPYI
jgi:hypothetical protein